MEQQKPLLNNEQKILIHLKTLVFHVFKEPVEIGNLWGRSPEFSRSSVPFALLDPPAKAELTALSVNSDTGIDGHFSIGVRIHFFRIEQYVHWSKH